MLLRCIFFLLLPGLLFARARYVPGAETKAEKMEQPWFTGSLLASGATTIPVGHWNVQPYFFATHIPSRYDNHWAAHSTPTFWALSTTLPIWIGLTQWMDIQIQPQWSWNRQTGVGSSWAFGDFDVQLEFQLYRDDFPPKNWIPNIKVAVRETFPTGKYRNLDPSKPSVEVGGAGSYSTEFLVSIGRLFHLSGVHYLSTRFNFFYTFFRHVHVKNFNTYGGGFGTDGTVHPKSTYAADFGMEISLTRNWAFALDLVGLWRGRVDFSGRPGTLTPTGFPISIQASNTTKSAIQYSIAPAIEYNFNGNLGLIFGPWFTVAGKNIGKFCSGVVSVNYYK